MPVFKNLTTLRERAGLSRAGLARLAKLHPNTVARMESGYSSRPSSLFRVGNCLNEAHYEKQGTKINLEEWVTALDQTSEASPEA